VVHSGTGPQYCWETVDLAHLVPQKSRVGVAFWKRFQVELGKYLIHHKCTLFGDYTVHWEDGNRISLQIYETTVMGRIQYPWQCSPLFLLNIASSYIHPFGDY